MGLNISETLRDHNVLGVALNETEAFSKIKELNPTLITVDISTVASGVDFIRKIKMLYPSLIVVVITLSRNNLEEEAMKLGADAYVKKPYQPTQLLQKLEQLQGISLDNISPDIEELGSRVDGLLSKKVSVDSNTRATKKKETKVTNAPKGNKDKLPASRPDKQNKSTVSVVRKKKKIGNNNQNKTSTVNNKPVEKNTTKTETDKKNSKIQHIEDNSLSVNENIDFNKSDDSNLGFSFEIDENDLPKELQSKQSPLKKNTPKIESPVVLNGNDVVEDDFFGNNSISNSANSDNKQAEPEFDDNFSFDIPSVETKSSKIEEIASNKKIDTEIEFDVSQETIGEVEFEINSTAVPEIATNTSNNIDFSKTNENYGSSNMPSFEIEEEELPSTRDMANNEFNLGFSLDSSEDNSINDEAGLPALSSNNKREIKPPRKKFGLGGSRKQHNSNDFDPYDEPYMQMGENESDDGKEKEDFFEKQFPLASKLKNILKRKK